MQSIFNDPISCYLERFRPVLVIADIIRLMGGYRIVGLIDDVNVARQGSEVAGIRILGGQEKLEKFNTASLTGLYSTLKR